jgi:hypothetical protein
MKAPAGRGFLAWLENAFASAPTPPRLRIWMLLALGFLGFGVLLGRTAGTGTGVSAASARSQLKLIVPRASAAASAGSDRSGGGEAAEPIGAQAPENAEATPTPGASETSAPKPHGGSGGEKESAGQAPSKSGSPGEGASGGTVVRKSLPAIKHVFLIVLSSEPYAAVFGPESKAGYISGQLEKQGELLARYDAVAHEGLADGIALISGQGPTPATAADCPTYAPIAPATAQEQVQGEGCIYPSATQTLPEQLAGKHLRWRAYVQGIDEGGSTAPACTHPASGAADPTADASLSTGANATFRNPFVYFQSLLAAPACAANDVGLAQLRTDLARASSTPSFSYVVPDRCHDGNPTPCQAGAPAGVAPAGEFLAQVVPWITSSQAYRKGGLIVITTDEAPAAGELGDSSSCCAQPHFPNLPAASGPGGLGRGGGDVGALLISPFVKGATISQEPYNHFSLLRTVEDAFKLSHLGYAGAAGVKSFAPALFTAAAAPPARDR